MPGEYSRCKSRVCLRYREICLADSRCTRTKCLDESNSQNTVETRLLHDNFHRFLAQHLGTWPMRICMDMLEIYGNLWISMDIYGPPAEHIRPVVLDEISILDIIHIHAYPCISIFYIQKSYLGIIQAVIHQGMMLRYPFISIFHFAYLCVFK